MTGKVLIAVSIIDLNRRQYFAHIESMGDSLQASAEMRGET